MKNRLPPSGYVPAIDSNDRGYLAKRMAHYRKLAKEQAEQQAAKVTQITRKKAAK